MKLVSNSMKAVPHGSWYKYGVAALVIEMAIAIVVSGYALAMTFHGPGGFLGKH